MSWHYFNVKPIKSQVGINSNWNYARYSPSRLQWTLHPSCVKVHSPRNACMWWPACGIPWVGSLPSVYWSCLISPSWLESLSSRPRWAGSSHSPPPYPSAQLVLYRKRERKRKEKRDRKKRWENAQEGRCRKDKQEVNKQKEKRGKIEEKEIKNWYKLEFNDDQIRYLQDFFWMDKKIQIILGLQDISIQIARIDFPEHFSENWTMVATLLKILNLIRSSTFSTSILSFATL